uniref:Uncharacterized protein n=1 Tax=Anopheles culicifacies TaxID=139723 RepID=A0A182MTF5_9DIPT
MADTRWRLGDTWVYHFLEAPESHIRDMRKLDSTVFRSQSEQPESIEVLRSQSEQPESIGILQRRSEQPLIGATGVLRSRSKQPESIGVLRNRWISGVGCGVLSETGINLGGEVSIPATGEVSVWFRAELHGTAARYVRISLSGSHPWLFEMSVVERNISNSKNQVDQMQQNGSKTT